MQFDRVGWDQQSHQAGLTAWVVTDGRGLDGFAARNTTGSGKRVK
jgi:hypothetical protein